MAYACGMNKKPLLMVIGLIVSWSLLGCGQEPAESPAATVEATEDEGSVGILLRIDTAGVEALIAETAAQNKVLVIDVWATWCVPCIEMFPSLHSGIEAMGDRVTLATISIDGEARETAVREYLVEQHALDNAYFMPDPAVQEATVDAIGEKWTNVTAPAILVFDRDGQLRGEFLQGGVVPDVLALAKQLAESQ